MLRPTGLSDYILHRLPPGRHLIIVNICFFCRSKAMRKNIGKKALICK